MIFTFFSYLGEIMGITGILLVIFAFVLVNEEGPYIPEKRVLFGNSLNNLIAGMVIGIIGFFMLCIKDHFFLH